MSALTREAKLTVILVRLISPQVYAVDLLRCIIALKEASQLLQGIPQFGVLRLVPQAPDPREFTVADQIVFYMQIR